MQTNCESKILISPGAVVKGTGVIVGGGLPAKQSLSEAVDHAAEVLKSTFGVSVVIRYNSNGLSGGAYVITQPGNTEVGSNSSIGISIRLPKTGEMQYNVVADVKYLNNPALADRGSELTFAGKYAYPSSESIAEAVYWIKSNCVLDI